MAVESSTTRVLGGPETASSEDDVADSCCFNIDVGANVAVDAVVVDTATEGCGVTLTKGMLPIELMAFSTGSARWVDAEFMRSALAVAT